MGIDNLEFSFSGLKTSLLYFMDDFQDEDLKSKADVIASYQKAIIDVLVEKVKRAMRVTKSNQCVIAGGVASNQSLRNTLQSTLKNKKIIFPDPIYCTDNGAMICFLGEKKLLFKKYDSLSFSALPNLKLS